MRTHDPEPIRPAKLLPIDTPIENDPDYIRIERTIVALIVLTVLYIALQLLRAWVGGRL